MCTVCALTATSVFVVHSVFVAAALKREVRRMKRGIRRHMVK